MNDCASQQGHPDNWLGKMFFRWRLSLQNCQSIFGAGALNLIYTTSELYILTYLSIIFLHALCCVGAAAVALRLPASICGSWCSSYIFRHQERLITILSIYTYMDFIGYNKFLPTDCVSSLESWLWHGVVSSKAARELTPKETTPKQRHWLCYNAGIWVKRKPLNCF